MSNSNRECESRPKINVAELCKNRSEIDEIPQWDKSCVSLEHRRRAPCAKPLSPRIKQPRCPAQEPEVPAPPPPCRSTKDVREKSRKKLRRKDRQICDQPVECQASRDVRVPCGVRISDYAKILGSHENRRKASSGSRAMKPCSSEKHRNALKTKLLELLRETQPIPESCLVESTEWKPEPELLAEVLLMSEAAGIDLADTKPDDLFVSLYSDVSGNQSMTVTNADPESMIDAVVPAQMTGQRILPIDLPNSEMIINNVRDEAPPNLSAFQQSSVYGQFPNHVSQLLERTPARHNITDLLGVSTLGNEISDNQREEDGTFEYVMKPGPASHMNRIHLNGSVRPNWFPGYAIVSPFVPEFTRMTDDPGEALKEAWKLCHPRYFDDHLRVIVNNV